MLRSLSFLLLALLSLRTLPLLSQQKDTVYLMNGNILVETVLDTTIGAVTVQDPERVGKRLHFDFENLFCVKYASGATKYYYTQDTAYGNYFTRDEMKMYILGERDARKAFKAKGSFYGAGLMGIAGGLTGSFLGPIAPYGFMALSGLPKVRIRHETVSNPNYIDSDAYILGYERVARSKRRIKALIGGTIGLGIGYGAYFLFVK